MSMEAIPSHPKPNGEATFEPSLGNTHLKSDDQTGKPPALPPRPTQVGLATLPPELLLEIASHLRWPDTSFSAPSLKPTPFILHPHQHSQHHYPLSSERQLLKLRLVSRDLGNCIALSPSFWFEIHFNRRTYFRPSSSQSVGVSQVGGLGSSMVTTPHPSLSTYAHLPDYHPTNRPPRRFHGIDSDAGLVQAHSQSWASTMSQLPNQKGANIASAEEGHATMDPATGVSLFMSDPRLASQSPSLGGASPTIPKSPGVLWQEKTASFIQFLRRLASLPETAKAVRQVVIEDIPNQAMVQELCKVLASMTELKELSLKRLVGFEFLINQTVPPLDESLKESKVTQQEQEQQRLFGITPRWQNLTRLDLTGSAQLRDIRGIRDAMPALTEVVLEGCHNIVDFRPLVRVGYLASEPSPQQSEISENNDGFPQRSNLKTLILSQTKLKDQDLIEIVKFSPNLRELRLEQCYELTIDSLLAIGQNQTTTMPSSSSLDPSEHASAPTDAPPPLSHQHGNFALTPTKPNATTHSICPNLRLLSLMGCWDLEDRGVRALVGCPNLEMLNIRGLRRVHEETIEWLHEHRVPLRKGLSPLGHWRHFQV